MGQPGKVANPVRDQLKKIGVASSVRLGRICLKNNMNASRPSEHPPVRGKSVKNLGGIIGCKKDKTSSWHLSVFSDGNNNSNFG